MTEAEQLEREIMEKSQQLAALRQAEDDAGVGDYSFQTLDGEVTLSGLFGGRERLLMIHNMGQGLPLLHALGRWHQWRARPSGGCDGGGAGLEGPTRGSAGASRSIAAGAFGSHPMAVVPTWLSNAQQGAMPTIQGAAVYQQKDGRIVRRGRTAFGPGDLYSARLAFSCSGRPWRAGLDASIPLLAPARSTR